MKESMKSMFVDISNKKYTNQELVNLVQHIAVETGIHTTTNFAKKKGKSYNGIKNHYPHFLIDGIRFHCNGIENNNLPF